MKKRPTTPKKKATRARRRPRKTTATRRTRVLETAAAKSRAARRGTGVAPGMPSVSTYLAVANIGATASFLERAFGFARGVTLPDATGQPRYAEMRHGDAVVMLVRKGDEASASGGQPALYAYVDDVDGVAARAREAGAGAGDAEDKPWGDRAAVITDPDGYRWILATFKKLVPFS